MPEREEEAFEIEVLFDHFLVVALDLVDCPGFYLHAQQTEHFVLSAFAIAAEQITVALQKVVVLPVLLLAPVHPKTVLKFGCPAIFDPVNFTHQLSLAEKTKVAFFVTEVAGHGFIVKISNLYYNQD